jgi:hypothetical protein
MSIKEILQFVKYALLLLDINNEKQTGCTGEATTTGLFFVEGSSFPGGWASF